MKKDHENEIINELGSLKNYLIDLEIAAKKLEEVFGRQLGNLGEYVAYDTYKSVDQVDIKFDELIAAIGDAIGEFENQICDLKKSGVFSETEHATY